ncbi:MAG: helix-turn-helix domain-containing protein [Gemmatimonadota bacterium]|nr:helix-turn-helix domain-containing protein [Gemmatimonadota bacterium]
MQTLGEVLRAARTAKGLSLRDIERASKRKISNGHLSMLEGGEIKQPSPHHLFLLAGLLDLDYARLMELAGYFMPVASPRAVPLPAGIAFSAGDLSPEDLALAEEYIGYLRSNERAVAEQSLAIAKVLSKQAKQ